MSVHLQAIYNDPHIGADAVYSDGATAENVRAILERNVEVWEGHAVTREDHISLQCSQVNNPEPGDTVTIDSVVYELVNRIEDDGLETKWSVKKQ